MDHVSCPRNTPQRAVSYLPMQLSGLLYLNHLIFRTCNDDDGHLKMPVCLSEVVRRWDHEGCFGGGSPDLRWTHGHLFRKTRKFLWDGARAENLAKKQGPEKPAKKRR